MRIFQTTICRRLPVRRARGGFTLIEVLVTATLLVVISAGIAVSLSTALRAFTTLQSRADGMDRDRVLSERLRADLLGVWVRPDSETTWFRGASPTAGQSTGALLPEGNLLSLTTSRSISFDAIVEDQGVDGSVGPQSDVSEVSWWLEPGLDGTLDLVRLERTPPDPELEAMLDPAVDRVVLVTGVVEMSLRFFDGLEWWEEWDSAGGIDAGLPTGLPQTGAIDAGVPAGLPRAVEVTLWLQGGAASAPGMAPMRSGSESSFAETSAPSWTMVVALPEAVEGSLPEDAAE